MFNPLERAKYVLAAHIPSQLPDDVGHEVAFAGRSNAGKSTALNALTRQNSLARVSKTPGRTQQLVFFEIEQDKYLVDLPGYGYAKVPHSSRTTGRRSSTAISVPATRSRAWSWSWTSATRSRNTTGTC